MIEVTKINGTKILVNSNLIESVEETPDTVITLTTGKKIIAKESRQDIKNVFYTIVNNGWNFKEVFSGELVPNNVNDTE